LVRRLMMNVADSLTIALETNDSKRKGGSAPFSTRNQKWNGTKENKANEAREFNRSPDERVYALTEGANPFHLRSLRCLL
jgi:hypothetical protein